MRVIAAIVIFLSFFLACADDLETVSTPLPQSPASPSTDNAPPVVRINPGGPAAEHKIFLDAAEGYRIRYPSDWTLSDQSRGTHMIRADLTCGRNTGLQIRVHKGVSTDLESYVDIYLESFRKDMEGHWKGRMVEESRDCGWIGDNRGCRVGLTFERPDGSSWFFVEYLLAKEGRVVILQCGTPLKDRYRHESVMDEIAGSLEFQDR